MHLEFANNTDYESLKVKLPSFLSRALKFIPPAHFHGKTSNVFPRKVETKVRQWPATSLKAFSSRGTFNILIDDADARAHGELYSTSGGCIRPQWDNVYVDYGEPWRNSSAETWASSQPFVSRKRLPPVLGENKSCTAGRISDEKNLNRNGINDD